jgi:predicted amidophosphoribosyltransferase
MQCPRCQRDNRAERRFCSGCGAELRQVCSRCGFANDPADQDAYVARPGGAMRLQNPIEPRARSWNG